jgi:hypothetical protein
MTGQKIRHIRIPEQGFNMALTIAAIMGSTVTALGPNGAYWTDETKAESRVMVALTWDDFHMVLFHINDVPSVKLLALKGLAAWQYMSEGQFQKREVPDGFLDAMLYGEHRNKSVSELLKLLPERYYLSATDGHNHPGGISTPASQSLSRRR